MKNYLEKLSANDLSLLKKIGTEADQRGLSAFIVGGIVRDIILRKEILDLDIVLVDDAIPFAKSIAKKFMAKVTLYKRFGTAHLVLANALHLDFATARKEYYPKPGALPVVRPAGLKDDLYRRDFTINALAICINKDHFGDITDPFKGMEDLQKKKIKILHPKSFRDDPTRILRNIRFEQRFHFKTERKTLALMKLAIRKKFSRYVKPPRYFSEFKKILGEAEPLIYLKRLKALKGFDFFGSAVKINFRLFSQVQHNIQSLRKNKLYQHRYTSWLIYFMVLSEGIKKQDLNKFFGKFHFQKSEMRSVTQCQMSNQIIKNLSVKGLQRSQIYKILKPLKEPMIFYLRVRTNNKIVCKRIDHYLSTDHMLNLFTNGIDLKKVGFHPGKNIGDALNQILYKKIDRIVCTRQDEIKEAKRILALRR